MAQLRIVDIRAAQDGSGGLTVEADVIGADGMGLPGYQRTFAIGVDLAQPLLTAATVEEAAAMLPGIAAQLDPAYSLEAIQAAEAAHLTAKSLVSAFLSQISLPLDIDLPEA